MISHCHPPAASNLCLRLFMNNSTLQNEWAKPIHECLRVLAHLRTPGEPMGAAFGCTAVNVGWEVISRLWTVKFQGIIHEVKKRSSIWETSCSLFCPAERCWQNWKAVGQFSSAWWWTMCYPVIIFDRQSSCVRTKTIYFCLIYSLHTQSSCPKCSCPNLSWPPELIPPSLAPLCVWD